MKDIKLFTEYNSEKDQYKKLYEASQLKIVTLEKQINYFDDHVLKLNCKIDNIKDKIYFVLNSKGSVVNTQKSYSCEGIRLMLNNLLK
jgi:hypothetical protein